MITIRLGFVQVRGKVDSKYNRTDY